MIVDVDTTLPLLLSLCRDVIDPPGNETDSDIFDRFENDIVRFARVSEAARPLVVATDPELQFHFRLALSCAALLLCPLPEFA